jgi:hypothetical protein
MEKCLKNTGGHGKKREQREKRRPVQIWMARGAVRINANRAVKRRGILAFRCCFGVVLAEEVEGRGFFRR